MSNRRNRVKNKRIKQIARDLQRSVPHDFQLKRKRHKLRKLRQKSLADASRHLIVLERRYREGEITESLTGRTLRHKRNKYMAEMFANARKRTEKLAKTL